MVQWLSVMMAGFDWCERVPGPADKVYSARNTATLYIPHSAVGYYAGWAGRLFSTARNPDGRYTDYAAASVHLWFPQKRTEKPKQHYSIWASCWASGSRYPNTNGVAAENEGGHTPVNEPLTDWQVECNARAIRELSALQGWQPHRPASLTDLTATLYEHRECVRWGSDPTSCPSGRIPWTRLIAGSLPMVPPTPVPPAQEEGDMLFVIHYGGRNAITNGLVKLPDPPGDLLGKYNQQGALPNPVALQVTKEEWDAIPDVPKAGPAGTGLTPEQAKAAAKAALREGTG